MPKPLIFAACEKIIIDDQGNASLIVLLQNVTVMVKRNETIPQNAVTPKEWAIFASWQTQANENGKKLRQIMEITYPKAELDFVVAEPSDQNRVNIVGFPVGQSGQYSIRMWLEENARKVTEELVYPFSVKHQQEA